MQQSVTIPLDMLKSKPHSCFIKNRPGVRDNDDVASNGHCWKNKGTRWRQWLTERQRNGAASSMAK